MSSSSQSGSRGVHDGFRNIPTVHYARAIFRSRIQDDGESIQSYVDTLRGMAVSCGYAPGVLEEQIRDQLIFGMKSKAMQHKFFFDEKYGITQLEQVISMAIAGEAFQKWRFGNQHPLENEEIQNLLGPHLDESSLLAMHLVSTSCQNMAVKEWDGQRRRQRKARCSLVPLSNREDLHALFGTNCLCITTSDEILAFIKNNSEGGVNTSFCSCKRWPVVGNGVLKLYFDEDQYIPYNEAYNDAINVGFCDNVVRFLQVFGTQVSVFVWKNWEYTLRPGDLKRMLSHIPHLRELWVNGSSPGSERSEDRVREGPWPALPYLDSLHSARIYEYRDSEPGWEGDPLLLAYGFQLKTLDYGPFVIPAHMMQQPQAFLLPLTNIEDFTVETTFDYIRKLGECTEWKIKRLSLTSKESNDRIFFSNIFVKGKDFDDCVNECGLWFWSFINQTSESLEELYVDIDDWQTFVQFFMLPAVHEHAKNSSSPHCSKVINLMIPYLFLIRAEPLLEVLCQTFPNLEHIQFINCEPKPDLNQKQNRQHVSSFPEWAKDLFLKEIIQIPFQELTGEHFKHFWNGFTSLQKITVMDEDNDVVFEHVRN